MEMYQSQLDTERQGVLRNMWLTSARLSTAAALTISLNMIIKVRSRCLKRTSEKLKIYLSRVLMLVTMFAGVDGPDSRQPHIQISEKQALKVCLQFIHFSCHGKYLKRRANQSDRLRDSTDFETQLYLCNEAFKVFSSTLSKLQQNFKISHIHIHKSYSQFKTLKLEHFMELCNESGKRKQN